MADPAVPTVLVVEDNSTNMALVRALLARHRCLVAEATSAASALEEARRLLPQLILMDLQLPDGDGLEVVRQLRALPDSRHIPIIALTAHAMAGDADRARAIGCDDYLTKPIDTRSFGQRVERYLGKTEGER